jgi:hypothetical protein
MLLAWMISAKSPLVGHGSRLLAARSIALNAVQS